MATAGPRYPGTVATEIGPSGDNDWTNASNIGADDGSEAQITAATYDAGDHSYRLKATNFGFSADIPAGSTINGITVEIDRRDFAGDAQDQEVRLYDANPSLVGDDKQTADSWPTTSAIATYGGASDTWNAGLTADDVRSSVFGVALIVLANSANTDIGVDFIRVTIDYTPPAGPTEISVPITVTFTVAKTQQVNLVKAITTTFTLAKSQLTSLARDIGITFGVSVIKQVLLPRAITVTFSVVEAHVRILNQLVEIGIAFTVATTQQVNKVVAIGVAFTVAMVRRVNLARDIAVAVGVSALKQVSLVRDIVTTFTVSSVKVLSLTFAIPITFTVSALKTVAKVVAIVTDFVVDAVVLPLVGAPAAYDIIEDVPVTFTVQVAKVVNYLSPLARWNKKTRDLPPPGSIDKVE